jgi:hypothetical protein
VLAWGHDEHTATDLPILLFDTLTKNEFHIVLLFISSWTVEFNDFNEPIEHSGALILESGFQFLRDRVSI